MLDEPFPAWSGPKLSLRQQQKQRKTLAIRKRTSSHSPPPPALPLRRRISHFVMNLPDSAITFLDAYRGIFSPGSVGGRDISGEYDNSMPMIHCHCFTRELEPHKAEADIRMVRIIIYGGSAYMGLILLIRGSRRSWDILWATRCLCIWCGRSPRIRTCIA